MKLFTAIIIASASLGAAVAVDPAAVRRQDETAPIMDGLRAQVIAVASDVGLANDEATILVKEEEGDVVPAVMVEVEDKRPLTAGTGLLRGAAETVPYPPSPNFLKMSSCDGLPCYFNSRGDAPLGSRLCNDQAFENGWPTYCDYTANGGDGACKRKLDVNQHCADRGEHPTDWIENVYNHMKCTTNWCDCATSATCTCKHVPWNRGGSCCYNMDTTFWWQMCISGTYCTYDDSSEEFNIGKCKCEDGTTTCMGPATLQVAAPAPAPKVAV